MAHEIALEFGQAPVDAPELGDRRPVMDEEREAPMYAGEGVGRLHEYAERHGAGEEAGPHNHVGHDDHKLIIEIDPKIEIAVVEIEPVVIVTDSGEELD